MTRDELAALDERATKGVWTIDEDNGAPFPAILTGPYELASFTAGEDADENQANAELSATLVNAWRSGVLVMVPSVESVALTLWRTNYHPDDVSSGRADEQIKGLQREWEQTLRRATAVLTSMGAKTDAV